MESKRVPESDEKYWQVADQPGREGPDYLFKGDSESKEVKKVLSSCRNWEGEGGRGRE